MSLNKKRVFNDSINNNEDYIPLSMSCSTPQSHPNSSSIVNNQSSRLNVCESNKRHKSHQIYGDYKLYPRLKEVLSSMPFNDDNSIVNYLQKTFPEYKRKKKSSLRRSVFKGLQLINDELSVNELDESDVPTDASIEDIIDSKSNNNNNSMNKSINQLYANKEFNNSPNNNNNNNLMDNNVDSVKTNKYNDKSFSKKSSNKKSETENNSKADRTIDSLLIKQIKLKERYLIDPKVTFEDFGGICSVIDEIKKLLFHLRHPLLYTTIGVEPPRGFLLHGPPGVGKTMIVEAIANDLKIPCLKCGATEIVAGISGESEEKIRELFNIAKSMRPCLLFIDEIDAITHKRENASKEMERRIVTQLLTCLDSLGTTDSSGVMVIGATNRPDAIDPALRRAGRFDREISLGIPDERARVDILKVLCNKIKLSENFDFEQLAHKTPGYVGADLKSLIRESAINALERVLLILKIDINSSLSDAELNIEEISSLLTIEMNDFESALKQVQPSSKREGFATVPDVTWSDIGALTHIRQELQLSILAPVKYQKDVQSLGLSTSVGILLCGPPGCGKTLLAKAIANESGINFISVKGPELLNMYVGESERAVRSVFNRARDSKPCVIFFDEIDALCPKRNESESSAVSSRVVNQLLTEMDGLESRNCFLLAATNRPDIVDPAILRPGRFDKILFVGFPSQTDRYEILRTLSKNGTKPPLSSDVDLKSVANDSRLDGFSGADLHSLLRESSLLALKQRISGEIKSDDQIVVNSSHIEFALNRVKPSVNESERKLYTKMSSTYFLQN